MTQTGIDKLDAYSASIIQRPGQMIDPRIFEQIEEQISPARLASSLASTIPYEDFVNALRLAP